MIYYKHHTSQPYSCFAWVTASGSLRAPGFSDLLQVMAVTGLISFLKRMKTMNIQRKMSRKHVLRTVAVLFCLNVGLNSLSLVRISITLNQTAWG